MLGENIAIFSHPFPVDRTYVVLAPIRPTIYDWLYIGKKRGTIARPNKRSKRRLFKFLGTNKKVEFVIFPFYVSIYPAIFCYDFLFLSWKLDKANSLFLMTFAIPYIVFQGATLGFLILEDEKFSLIYILIYYLCALYIFFRFRLK